MRKRKPHTCSKCGSKEAYEWMEKNDYLCNKCYEKWDKLMHSEAVENDKGWNNNFDATWVKYWSEFAEFKEKVVFT